MGLIDPQEVHKAFINCLAAVPDENPDIIVVEGIMGRYAMNKTVLEIHREVVTDWLNELPAEFHKIGTRDGAQDGWSFLNVCTDRHGNLWTGMHQTCEELLVLGMALNMVTFMLPRDLWKVLPGGMPYLQVDTTV